MSEDAPIPLFDAAPQHLPLMDELVTATERILRSGRFVLGEEVARFEAALAQALGAKQAIGVSSGSDALLACLMALDIGPGDEVLVPAYSFFATVGCVLRLGARPRFVDIDPQSFNAEAALLEAAIGPNTKAVIVVHLFGRPVQGLERLAARVPLIEDAAQATGAQALTGLAACYSFFPTKNLGACGDGGAVLTQDADFAGRLRRIRAHGSSRKYHHEEAGGNFRLDALQAALLAVKLPHLRVWNAQRRKLAERYRDALGEQLLFQKASEAHVYHQCVLRSTQRETLRQRLRDARIGSEVYYPVPLHRQAWVAQRLGTQAACPNAEALAEEALALPCFPGLEASQQARVIDRIRRSLT